MQLRLFVAFARLCTINEHRCDIIVIIDISIFLFIQRLAFVASMV